MLALLIGILSLVQVVDASNGRPLMHVEVAVVPDAHNASRVMVEADGAPLNYADFHGSFPATQPPRVIRLLSLSADERRALDRVNAFRASFHQPPLQADENLMETARYWAREERLAGRIGHTCAQLRSPAGCLEFNAYFHSLPGAPLDWFAGQNAAFDTISSWIAPETGFENERLQTGGERGHFLNLIEASRWIGLGKTRVPGYGAYFAMNLI